MTYKFKYIMRQTNILSSAEYKVKYLLFSFATKFSMDCSAVNCRQKSNLLIITACQLASPFSYEGFHLIHASSTLYSLPQTNNTFKSPQNVTLDNMQPPDLQCYQAKSQLRYILRSTMTNSVSITVTVTQSVVQPTGQQSRWERIGQLKLVLAIDCKQ